MNRTLINNGLVLMSFFSSVLMAATTSPSSVILKVYGVAVSPNTDCSNPTIIFEKTSPDEVDFTGKPDVGGGGIPDGSYRCVIIKMSDVIRFKPKTSITYCNADQQYSLDVCQTGSTTTSWAGVSSACAGQQSVPSESTVYLHLSLTGTTGNGGFTPGTALPLNGAFSVSGNSMGKFVANFTDKVTNQNGSCDCEPPEFGFVNIVSPPSL